MEEGAKEYEWSLEGGNDKKTDSPLEPRKRNSASLRA